MTTNIKNRKNINMIPPDKQNLIRDQKEFSSFDDK